MAALLKTLIPEIEASESLFNRDNPQRIKYKKEQNKSI